MFNILHFLFSLMVYVLKNTRLLIKVLICKNYNFFRLIVRKTSVTSMDFRLKKTHTSLRRKKITWEGIVIDFDFEV